MTWQSFIGPATLIYMISATIAGVWWAADLSARVSASERAVASAAAASDRIVRLETLVGKVDEQLTRIENKMENPRDR